MVARPITLAGTATGDRSAVRMAANMVDPRTGTVAAVLRLPPNGPGFYRLSLCERVVSAMHAGAQ